MEVIENRGEIFILPGGTALWRGNADLKKGRRKKTGGQSRPVFILNAQPPGNHPAGEQITG
ncbi:MULTISPECIES: hypothetical protein [Yersiniaceae]|uniref:Uncharacterized protein n=1 Tax=Nissabacter archeti TaxID=1917880 RepID=A0ABS5JE64_9GAMM|nr:MULTISPECIES: hypothetical protein [Yersiniaceae]MBS0968237.1 hypothetical protein [Nissabacter archeti]MDV5139435.1 hypothetical protein [Chimaeribacter arupi]WKZ91548.1 hypothetical protein P0E69_15245 [Chimaeribacter arupi]